MLIAQAVYDKKGHDLVLLHVSELTSVSDYYLICSADSEPQVRAIVDAVDKDLSKKKVSPFGVEGMKTASWVLVDYGDVLLHIFRNETRAFYNLDSLWVDAERIDLSTIEKSLLKKTTTRKKKDTT
ncbi:MAG: ribosome silencing factor [Nitrospirota bacterium]